MSARSDRHFNQVDSIDGTHTPNGFNPFYPTGQFFAPKLIIFIKCLIDILFFKVLF